MNFNPGLTALLKTTIYGNRDAFLSNLQTTNINMGNTVINPGGATYLTTGSSIKALLISDKAEEEMIVMQQQ